jgi:hypothetical protein
MCKVDEKKLQKNTPGQDAVLRALLEQVDALPDAPVRRIAVGTHLAAVAGPRLGLGSRLGGHGTPPAPAPDTKAPTAKAVAAWLNAPPEPAPTGDVWRDEARALALAACNALLPVPANAQPRKGQDIILERGAGRNVAVVGHFPFVERMGPSFRRLWVLEKDPRPGDLHAAHAPDVLPRADLVAVTATTLLNGTLAGILALCRPGAFVFLLGPSTPFASCLFDLGVDALAGAVVDDEAVCLAGVERGLPFRGLRGVRSLAWEAGA